MTLSEFNNLPTQSTFEELFKCCGSTNWCNQLVNKKPFNSLEQLKMESDKIWDHCSEEDWREAFLHHPKIGDVKSLEKKFASSKEWASGEQAGINIAATKVLHDLAKGNSEYEKRFGFIFIVCATGKSADEMLNILRNRLRNDPSREIIVAMEEQNKITHIRIDKLFS